MNFINFRDFSDFFLIIFSILNRFFNKKMGLFFARGHVDATWQSRPRGSATWTHAAPTQQGEVSHIYIYITYYI